MFDPLVIYEIMRSIVDCFVQFLCSSFQLPIGYDTMDVMCVVCLSVSYYDPVRASGVLFYLFTLYAFPLILFLHIFRYLSPPLLIFSFENRPAPFAGQRSKEATKTGLF